MPRGGVLVGIVVALAFLGILLLPWHIQIRWRKSWQGSLAWRWHCRCLGIPIGKVQRGRRIHLQDWIDPHSSISPILKHVKASWRLHRWLLSHVHVHDWDSHTTIGLEDPILTGQWIGLMAGLPPQINRSLHLTFTRLGFRTQGTLTLSIRLLWLLPCMFIWLQIFLRILP